MTTLLALSVFSGFFGGVDAPSKGFAAWQDTLKGKTSISAKVTVQEVGGTSNSYTIDMKKPNLLRLDTGSTLVVADGKNITTFDKKQGVYYKQPQTDEDMKVLLGDDQYSLFTGFFGDAPDLFKTEDGARKSLGGDQVLEVKGFYDKSGKKVQSFYVGSDNIAKRASITAKKQQGGDYVAVINAKDLVVNGSQADTLYAFNAPDDAKEINYQDLISSKWFHDLDEAKLIATRTHKKIFVDFMASWCGPCKMMDQTVFQTDEFKALGKGLVFCKIDIDLNPALADQYGVEAIPNMFVIRPDGSVVGHVLGYTPADQFIPQIQAMIDSTK
ncbi:MAG: thioredoxin family protein [Armatimonadetes bacterium]|nr:thioredoxin family protein [Armatimonadota bacterium]MBS1725759.1 thioredoxin family protein [Armatimonadota bacterium]